MYAMTRHEEHSCPVKRLIIENSLEVRNYTLRPIRSRARDRAALPDTQSNNPLTQPLLVTQSDESSMPALPKKTRHVAQSNSITESHNNNVPATPKQTVTVRNRPENKDYAIWSYTLFAIGAVLTFAASVVLPEVRFYEEDICGYIFGEGEEHLELGTAFQGEAGMHLMTTWWSLPTGMVQPSSLTLLPTITAAPTYPQFKNK
ncbi:Uncharacterized protein Adt_24792 [Abeliophyllum distichum]|uniref:Uncharacterized protein n=1 Tax=Abeliophyllum distichum TaxID=126358 RepID=A0ABD1SES3_9LAMI